MLPSATGHPRAVPTSPGIGVPSPMVAEAVTNGQNVSDAAADDAFFRGLYASALAASPPSARNAINQVLHWPAPDGVAVSLPCDPDVSAAVATTATPGPFMCATGDAVPVGGSIETDGPRASPPNPSLPLLDVLGGLSGAGTVHAQPQFSVAGSNGYPVIDGLAAPVGRGAAADTPTLLPHAAASAHARPMNAPAPAKATAKVGGARQPRRAKRPAVTGTARQPRHDVDPDDVGPDNTVCLLAVGPKTQQAAGTGNLGSVNSAASLADTIRMLTVEIGRNGRVTETEHVETGERAVVQVKALAECEMRFGIVVLEVEESLASAAATAKNLRAANDSTPIVAVGPPHAFRDTPAQLMPGERWLNFNEVLMFPIRASIMRGLVSRYLLSPRHIAEVAVRSGLAGEAVSPGPTAAMTFGQLGQHTAGDGDIMVASSLPEAVVAFGQGPSQFQQPDPQHNHQKQQGGLPNDATWVVPHDSKDGAGGPSTPDGGRVSSAPLGKPRASTLSSLEARVFGGGAEDRASPCKLFGQDFAKKNDQMDEREYDFVFRHGTIVLRVSEDEQGNAVPVIFSACEYATGHFGESFIGKPLKWLFDHPATNQKTVAKIVRHVEQSDTDSMCSYINLRREGQWVTSAFVSVRSLSKRPKRGYGEPHPPEWYVLLKVCLPSTLGLIKEPELLESMYSKKATEKTTTATAAKISKRSRSKAGSKRGAKKGKATPAASDSQEIVDTPVEGSHLAGEAPPRAQPG